MLVMRDVSNVSLSDTQPQKIRLGDIFKPRSNARPLVVADREPEPAATIVETVSNAKRVQAVSGAVRGAIDSEDYRAVLHLAVQSKRKQDVGLADQLFERGLQMLQAAESGTLSRVLGGVMSTAESEARVEWGRMLEDNGVYDRAMAVYSSCSATDVLLERRLALLIRLGRLSEAAAVAETFVRPDMVKSASEAQRLASLGLASQQHTVPAAVNSVLSMSVGAVSAALRMQENKKDLLLQAAEQMRRAHCIAEHGSDQLQQMAEQLSCPLLRDNLRELSDSVRRGAVTATIEKLATSIEEHIRLDWRVMLCLAVVRPEHTPSLLVQSAKQCDAVQRWKVWLEAASLSVSRQNGAVAARSLLQRALKEAPEKQRSMLLCEAARTELAVGSTATAEKILEKCFAESAFWKAGLELSVLRRQQGRSEEATAAIMLAIESNPLIGRLWATLARWSEESVEQRDSVVAFGLKLVPRSGELWVERARSLARESAWGQDVEACWSNALVFTPQYGDLFIEMARAALWRRLASRFGSAATRGQCSVAELDEETAAWDTEAVEQMCALASPNHGLVWDRLAATLGGENCCLPIQVLAIAKREMRQLLEDTPRDVLLRDALYAEIK